MSLRDIDKTRDALFAIVGKRRVIFDPLALKQYSEDMTEAEPAFPDIAVKPRSVEEVRKIVKYAAQERIPITPVVAGTNLGGLALPAEKGIVMDLKDMNNVVELNREEMYAILEPGVTFGQLKEHMEHNAPELTIGYPLSPPNVSVMCNCLLDGLGNLSLKHGSMGEWINGIEAVLPNGEVIKTGAGSLSPVWFSRAPLPDLTGLFVNWQGTTGIVTKLAVQLWPKPAQRKRSFLMFYKAEDGFSLIREIARRQIADDLGGLTWPATKMLLGVRRPTKRDPNEPEFYLYSDITGNSRSEIRHKEKIFQDIVRPYLKKMEGPLNVDDLIKFVPEFARFADFPMTLDFLLEEGGLTWVGTYGPSSLWGTALRKVEKVLDKHGLPHLAVLRPMKGGHFGVLRFITIFNKKEPQEVIRARKVNEAVCDIVLELGFIPYKAPAWAVKKFYERMDKQAIEMIKKIKNIIDPQRIMNPGRWLL